MSRKRNGRISSFSGPKNGPNAAPSTGMLVEQTAVGCERRLEANGIGRFFGAPFLIFWLAGWAVGEFFALSFLCKGAWSFFGGHSRGGHDLAGIGAALAAGLFMIV